MKDRPPDRTSCDGLSQLRHATGQATVEFALTLPLIAIVMAFVVQIALIVAVQIEVVAETSRLTRIASMAEDPYVAARGTLSPTSRSSIEVDFDDEFVTVTVTRKFDTDIAIIGRLLPDFDIRSSLTSAREPIEPSSVS